MAYHFSLMISESLNIRKNAISRSQRRIMSYQIVPRSTGDLIRTLCFIDSAISRFCASSRMQNSSMLSDDPTKQSYQYSQRMAATGRKYTIEQLEAELARPKSKGGRPKKYQTEEERKRANAEYVRRHNHRVKNESQGIVDETYASRNRTHQTEEDRRIAHCESSKVYVASHLDQHRLCVAAASYQLRYK